MKMKGWSGRVWQRGIAMDQAKWSAVRERRDAAAERGRLGLFQELAGLDQREFLALHLLAACGAAASVSAALAAAVQFTSSNI